MERGRRKLIEGIVLSRKMDKTAIVQVMRNTAHPVFGKVIRRRSKFFVHDENNACSAGDRVKISECRPLSKNKRWRLVAILEKAKGQKVEGVSKGDSAGK